MVTKKIATRDYLRALITKANKEAGITFNASKLNSKEKCEEYLLNLIKNLRHNAQPQKNQNTEGICDYEKVNEDLKDRVKKLESERVFYITQAKEAGEKREEAEKEKEYYRNHAKYWNNSYYEKDDKLSRAESINFFFGVLVFVEALSIALLSWK